VPPPGKRIVNGHPRGPASVRQRNPHDNANRSWTGPLSFGQLPKDALPLLISKCSGVTGMLDSGSAIPQKPNGVPPIEGEVTPYNLSHLRQHE
jgi:hypothetical protein